MPITDEGLTLSPRVIQRIRAVGEHIERMTDERRGYGDDAMTEVHETALSFVRALTILVEAESVWPDGGTGLAFCGREYSGIMFGMIDHHRLPKHPHMVHWPIRWSYHS